MTTTVPVSATTPTLPATSTVATDRPPTTTIALSNTTTVDEGRIEIRVENGAVVEGPPELRVELGSEVRLRVRSDTADHVHVHGYDLYFEVSPAQEVAIEFIADVPGVFEVEFENAGLLLLEIEVS